MDEKKSIYIVKVEGTGTIEIMEGERVLAVACTDPPHTTVALNIQVTTNTPAQIHFRGSLTWATVRKWEPITYDR